MNQVDWAIRVGRLAFVSNLCVWSSSFWSIKQLKELSRVIWNILFSLLLLHFFSSPRTKQFFFSSFHFTLSTLPLSTDHKKNSNRSCGSAAKKNFFLFFHSLFSLELVAALSSLYLSRLHKPTNSINSETTAEERKKSQTTTKKKLWSYVALSWF